MTFPARVALTAVKGAVAFLSVVWLGWVVAVPPGEAETALLGVDAGDRGAVVRIRLGLGPPPSGGHPPGVPPLDRLEVTYVEPPPPPLRRSFARGAMNGPVSDHSVPVTDRPAGRAMGSTCPTERLDIGARFIRVCGTESSGKVSQAVSLNESAQSPE